MSTPAHRASMASMQETMNRAVRDYMEQWDRVSVATAHFYRPRPPLTRIERAQRRARAWARWPFERLRDRLVAWLGCDCDY